MAKLRFPIYLDHHATTPLDSRVLKEMMPYLTEKFGNASSLDHSYGYEASVAVEAARRKIAKVIGARPDEIVFTSGATESDNLALIGTMSKYKNRGNHMITCVTEHKAVLDTTRHLESLGKTITYLPVNEFGEINLGDLEDSITDDTVMISVMAANNEIGTIQGIKEVGRIAHEKEILFHTDAAQAIGHIPIDVVEMNIDLMSFSSHKLYGPKGIGALYIRGIRPRVNPDPIVHGGGQERNIRSGTLNVPGIVGFGKATELAARSLDSEARRLSALSAILLERLADSGAELNGHPKKRLPHNTNVRFPGIDGKAIINMVSKEVAISAGSACTTQTVEPSHVLLAIGLGEEGAHSSIRIGTGRFNTEEEIRYAAERIAVAVQGLRDVSARV